MLQEYLKNYRKKHGYSQNEMAKVIGTNQGYYSMIESGRRKPGFKLIKKLAMACNVTPEFIVSLL